MDAGGEKGDANRKPPRKLPDGWKGPWPPKSDNSGGTNSGEGNSNGSGNNNSTADNKGPTG
jgi:hypothetical protein